MSFYEDLRQANDMAEHIIDRVIEGGNTRASWPRLAVIAAYHRAMAEEASAEGARSKKAKQIARALHLAMPELRQLARAAQSSARSHGWITFTGDDYAGLYEVNQDTGWLVRKLGPGSYAMNPTGAVDEDAVRELTLYIDNDADLYRQMAVPIAKNLVTKMAKGTYNSTLAVKAYEYLAEAGAKKYAKEFGGTWHVTFPPAVRREAAKEFRDSFEVLARDGEWDHLLPKKYQRNPKSENGPRETLFLNLEGKSAKGVDLSFRYLRYASLYDADLSGADLHGADLQGVDMSFANLEGANLESANLMRTKLVNANLRKADLRGALLRGANLLGADLKGAKLDEDFETSGVRGLR